MPPPPDPATAPPPPSEVYYAEEGEELGPVAEEDLRDWLDAGILPDTILVWMDGWPQWRPATALRRDDTGGYR